MSQPGEYAVRLDEQIARQPHFDQYPVPAALDFAIEVVLELLEEQEYEDDRHRWCHERPILLALVQAALQTDGGPDGE